MRKKYKIILTGNNEYCIIKTEHMFDVFIRRMKR